MGKAPLRSKASKVLCVTVRGWRAASLCSHQPQLLLFLSATRPGTEFGELDNVTSKKQSVYKTREHGEGLFLDQNLTIRELTPESNVLTRLEREGLAQTRCKEADSGLGLSGKPHLL